MITQQKTDYIFTKFELIKYLVKEKQMSLMKIILRQSSKQELPAGLEKLHSPLWGRQLIITTLVRHQIENVTHHPYSKLTKEK